jgi:hypothetical protein
MTPLLLLLRLILPPTDAMPCIPVDHGTVSDTVWQQLLADGWHGDPTDRAERLYCPTTHA